MDREEILVSSESCSSIGNFRIGRRTFHRQWGLALVLHGPQLDDGTFSCLLCLHVGRTSHHIDSNVAGDNARYIELRMVLTQQSVLNSPA
jgi:hypothetical protein